MVIKFQQNIFSCLLMCYPCFNLFSGGRVGFFTQRIVMVLRIVDRSSQLADGWFRGRERKENAFCDEAHVT